MQCMVRPGLMLALGLVVLATVPAVGAGEGPAYEVCVDERDDRTTVIRIDPDGCDQGSRGDYCVAVSQEGTQWYNPWILLGDCVSQVIE